MKTKLLYYQNQHIASCSTEWEYRGQSNGLNVIAVAETVAFPEGGGQCPDYGRITQGGNTLPFVNVQKASEGRLVQHPDYPTLLVDREVQLHIAGDIGMLFYDVPITIEIDTSRRNLLTRSHTAAHLVFLALKAEFPGMLTKGCHIDLRGGRFDISVGGGERFTIGPEAIANMTRFVDSWVSSDYEITMESMPGEPEVRVWQCNRERIPCGGTHLSRTGGVGRVVLSRKTKGPTLERVQYLLIDDLNANL